MIGNALAILTGEDIKAFEVIQNKIHCASNNLRPDIIPLGISIDEAKKFFKESIFSLADSQSLDSFFWKDLISKHNLSSVEITKLWLDFDSHVVYLRE